MPYTLYTVGKAGSISTMIIYVTKAKERPIGAIGACRRTRGDPHAHPMHEFGARGGTQHMSLSAANVQTQCSG